MVQKVKCNVLHLATVSILEATKKKQGNLNSYIAHHRQNIGQYNKHLVYCLLVLNFQNNSTTKIVGNIP